MNDANKIVKYLQGKKTYLLALLTAVYGIVEYHHSLKTLAPFVLTGGLATTLRAGVAKIEVYTSHFEAKLPTSIANEVKPAVDAVNALESDANKILG